MKRLLLMVAALGAGAFVVWNFLPRHPAWVDEHVVVASTPEVEVVRTGHLRSLRVAQVSADRVYASEDLFLYAGGHGDDGFSSALTYDEPEGALGRVKHLVGRTRIARMVRGYMGADRLTVLGSGTLVMNYKGALYRAPKGSTSFEKVFTLPDGIEIHPLAMTHDAADIVYFGEFFEAKPGKIASVWQGADDGRTWRKVYTYPVDRIGHIHTIVYDRFRNRLWIATGDLDDQSEISWTDDAFTTLHLLVRGSQDFSTCNLIPLPDRLVWGTHGSVARGKVMGYDFRTEKVETLAEINRAIWFATNLQDGTLALGTTYEPIAPISTADALPKEIALLVSQDGRRWTEVEKFGAVASKEHLGASIGYLAPGNADTNVLYYTPFSVEGADNNSVLRYEVHWRAPAGAQ